MSVQISPTFIPLAKADQAIGAAKAKAEEFGVPFTVSIVDAGAHLVAAARQDGAALAAVETSQVKARTAVLFGQATKDLAGAVQPGAPLFGIEAATSGPLAFVGGGVPVRDAHGVVIGAIGVGGGSPDQDHEVAEAALAAL